MDIYVFGVGMHSQLGLGPNCEKALHPELITQLPNSNFRTVYCGRYHSAIVSENGEVYTWGGSSHKKLGHTNPTYFPGLVTTMQQRRISLVACGNKHTIVLTEFDELYAWGSNEFGMLGINQNNWFFKNKKNPQRIESLSGKGVKQVTCGAEHTLCLLHNGFVFAWGRGKNYRLGLGDERNRQLPVHLQILQNQKIEQITCGPNFSAVLSSTGTVFTWGKNSDQLGYSMKGDPHIPHTVGINAKIIMVACGRAHMAAISDAGKVYTWGHGGSGRLGQGWKLLGSNNRLSPAPITTLDGHRIVQVVCGSEFTLALSSEGKVFGFGKGENISTLKNKNAWKPTTIREFEGKNVLFLAAGFFHTVVLAMKPQPIETQQPMATFQPQGISQPTAAYEAPPPYTTKYETLSEEQNELYPNLNPVAVPEPAPIRAQPQPQTQVQPTANKIVIGKQPAKNYPVYEPVSSSPAYANSTSTTYIDPILATHTNAIYTQNNNNNHVSYGQPEILSGMYPQDIDFVLMTSPSAPPVESIREANATTTTHTNPKNVITNNLSPALASKPPLSQATPVTANTFAITTPNKESNKNESVARAANLANVHYPTMAPVPFVPESSTVDSIASHNSSIISLSPLQRLYSAASSNSEQSAGVSFNLELPPIQFDEEIISNPPHEDDTNSVQSDSTIQSQHEQEEEVDERDKRMSFIEPTMLFDANQHAPERAVSLPTINIMEAEAEPVKQREEEPEVHLKVKEKKVKRRSAALIPA